jgi:hypothetical protein
LGLRLLDKVIHFGGKILFHCGWRGRDGSRQQGHAQAGGDTGKNVLQRVSAIDCVHWLLLCYLTALPVPRATRLGSHSLLPFVLPA